MAIERFKLPQSSYQELVKIIRAYGGFTQPASLNDASQVTGMDTSVISRNMGFFVAVGVMEAGQKKALTQLGHSLAQALDHEMESEIAKSWTEIVKENDFLAKVVTAVRIRSGMDEDTLESHIAYSAGQPKKKGFMTGARAVVEILRTAGLVEERDGMLVALEPGQTTDGRARQSAEEARTPLLKPGREDSRALAAQAEFRLGEVDVVLNVNIACKPGDLTELGDAISKLLEELGKNRQDGAKE